MNLEGIPHIGEILALASPLTWSFAVILFRRTGEVVPPFALNLFKNVVGMVAFGITLLVLRGGTPEGVGARDYALLLASGAIGIALADTLFLASLNRIGAGRQAIVNTAYSPPIIVLSAIFLGERLTALQVGGVVCILGAVAIVGRSRGEPGEDGARVRSGVLIGLGGYLAQAVSIVMVKPFMDGWPLVWTTAWRLFGGLLAMLVMLPFLPPRRRRLRPLLERSIRRPMVLASFLGTYLALLFWMGGFKYTTASKSSALNQTATLFTFVLAVLLLREPVTPRRLAGLALGVLGVALVVLTGGAG